MQKTFLFVYGTLKRGGSNHKMMNNSTCIGSAKLAPGTTLYTNGHYPMMVECDKNADATGVEGEVFEVDASTLARLDSFEGHPRLFKRVPVDVGEIIGNENGFEPINLDGTVYAYMFQRPISQYKQIGVSFNHIPHF